jgi:hypothetical protein
MWAAPDRTGTPIWTSAAQCAKLRGQITHLIVATAGPTSSPLGTRRPARGLARSPGGAAVGQRADVLVWASRRGGGLGVAASTLLLVLPPGQGDDHDVEDGQSNEVGVGFGTIR